ncbi:MAG: metallophosphoesterase [Acidobacteria bacterium]|jgi:hypothetical protein|nr:metallophosphoesterase [Acidobacteriota bacterium]
MYGTTLTLAAVSMLAYALWRASSLPGLRKIPRRSYLAGAIVLVLMLVVGRQLGHDGSGPWAAVMEFISMNLIGASFLIFVCLFPADLALGFGLFFPRRAAGIRSLAILAGCLLALLALFQGLRPPQVVRYEVFLPGLPPELDGTRLAAISDLHLGTLIGPGWLQARVSQVQDLKPDMILVLGDVFEGHGAAPDAFIPGLRRLSAPLGVWAVDGNHGRREWRSLAPGPVGQDIVRTLRDEMAQPAPGLFLAGRRYLSRHERERSMPEWNPGKAPGAMILMAHAPTSVHSAARAGFGLMLSGHTHGGQIWPLSIATRMANPLLAGRYDIQGMTVLVSRGAGTWGPRMRLWRPGDILLVILRTPRH